MAKEIKIINEEFAKLIDKQLEAVSEGEFYVRDIKTDNLNQKPEVI